MTLRLTNSEAEIAELKKNPLQKDKRPVELWTEGETTLLGGQPIELIHCNVRIGQVMQVRQVLLDPDYFLLVEVLPFDETKVAH